LNNFSPFAAGMKAMGFAVVGLRDEGSGEETPTVSGTVNEFKV